MTILPEYNKTPEKKPYAYFMGCTVHIRQPLPKMKETSCDAKYLFHKTGLR